jgi:hypothetical protein
VVLVGLLVVVLLVVGLLVVLVGLLVVVLLAVGLLVVVLLAVGLLVVGLLVVAVFCDGAAYRVRKPIYLVPILTRTGSNSHIVLVPFLSLCSFPSRRRNAKPRWPSLAL